MEIIGCVKDCCKEEKNRLFSMHLVNSTKRGKIKSQHEKFGLDAKGNLLVDGWRVLPVETVGSPSLEEVVKDRLDRSLPENM